MPHICTAKAQNPILASILEICWPELHPAAVLPPDWLKFAASLSLVKISGAGQKIRLGCKFLISIDEKIYHDSPRTQS